MSTFLQILLLSFTLLPATLGIGVQKVIRSQSGVEYAILDTLMVHEEAVNACDSLSDFEGARFLELTDVGEFEVVFQEFIEESVWVGEERDASLDGSDPLNYGLVQPFSDTSLSIWFTGEPVNNEFRRCLSVLNKNILTSTCGLKRSVICQRQKNGPTKLRIGEKEIFFFEGIFNSSFASTTCANLEVDGVRDSSLLTIESVSESDEIFEFAKQQAIRVGRGFGYYLAYRASSEQALDPSPAQYGVTSDFGSIKNAFPWRNGHPIDPAVESGSCSFVTSASEENEYVWETANCNSLLLNLVCERSAPEVRTPSPSRSPTSSPTSTETEVVNSETSERGNFVYPIILGLLFVVMTVLLGFIVGLRKKYLQEQDKMLEFILSSNNVEMTAVTSLK